MVSPSEANFHWFGNLASDRSLLNAKFSADTELSCTIKVFDNQSKSYKGVANLRLVFNEVAVRQEVKWCSVLGKGERGWGAERARSKSRGECVRSNSRVERCGEMMDLNEGGKGWVSEIGESKG